VQVCSGVTKISVQFGEKAVKHFILKQSSGESKATLARMPAGKFDIKHGSKLECT
jgi:hypothetical protein